MLNDTMTIQYEAIVIEIDML